jgi:hypothetical protein
MSAKFELPSTVENTLSQVNPAITAAASEGYDDAKLFRTATSQGRTNTADRHLNDFALLDGNHTASSAAAGGDSGGQRGQISHSFHLASLRRPEDDPNFTPKPQLEAPLPVAPRSNPVGKDSDLSPATQEELERIRKGGTYQPYESR